VRNDIVQGHIQLVWQQLKNGDYSSKEFDDEMEWLHDHLDPNDPEFSAINLQKAILSKQAL